MKRKNYQIIIYLFLFNFLFRLSFTFPQEIDTSVVLGRFKLLKIVDGDTFKFEKMDNSTRLLCIDTEEMFKGKDAEKKANEIAVNWPEFYLQKKGDSKMPAKVDTPFGYEAYLWAKEFMKGIDSVTLELDDNIRTIDMYNRNLVYVIVYKNGRRMNYNLECIKNGYSPYFMKYGYSRRFHSDFVDAQNEAKKKKVGIWDNSTKCYPDYEQRIIWLEKRANQLSNFENNYTGRSDVFSLLSGNFNDLDSLIGKDIIVFGTISEVLAKSNKYLLIMPHSRGESIDLTIYEENYEVLKGLNLEELSEFNVYAKGKLEKHDKYYNIKIESARQIWIE